MPATERPRRRRDRRPLRRAPREPRPGRRDHGRHRGPRHRDDRLLPRRSRGAHGARPGDVAFARCADAEHRARADRRGDDGRPALDQRRALRARGAPPRPQRARLPGPGDPAGLRPDADRHRARLGDHRGPRRAGARGALEPAGRVRRRHRAGPRRRAPPGRRLRAAGGGVDRHRRVEHPAVLPEPRRAVRRVGHRLTRAAGNARSSAPSARPRRTRRSPATSSRSTRRTRPSTTRSARSGTRSGPGCSTAPSSTSRETYAWGWDELHRIEHAMRTVGERILPGRAARVGDRAARDRSRARSRARTTCAPGCRTSWTARSPSSTGSTSTSRTR